jgi:hypothetical protein
MKIGISIDGVLRDLFGKIEDTHQKYFPSEDDENVKVLDYDFDKWLTFPEEETKQAESRRLSKHNDCLCGGKFKTRHRAVHYRTIQHQTFLKLQQMADQQII